jgi:methyl-accepting chemotaxis protein
MLNQIIHRNIFLLKVKKIGFSIIFGTVSSLIFILISKQQLLATEIGLLIAIVSAAFIVNRVMIDFKQQQLIKKIECQLTDNLNGKSNSETSFDDNYKRVSDLVTEMIKDKDEQISFLKEVESDFLKVLSNIEGKIVNQEEQYNEFNSIIFELSGGIDIQTKSAQDTSQAMEQIVNGVTQVAEKSRVASSSSMMASRTAEEGKLLVTSVLNQMDKINLSFSTLSEIVKGFEVSTKEIGTIIEEISNIANQTNLLSLNASIEAARAGKEGKGFAVVANEVGKLSKQSNQFAERISDLIKGIQGQAVTANGAMDVSAKDVVSGLQIVEKSAASFQSIIKTTETINQQIHEISAISQEMSARSKHVAASAEEITLVSRKSNQLFNNVIPIIIEQFDATNTISDMVKNPQNKSSS